SVIRWPAIAINRSCISLGNDEARTSKRSSTALASVLTFCPPGPDARTKRSTTPCSSMLRVSGSRIAGTVIAPQSGVEHALRHHDASEIETPVGPLDDVVVISKSDVPLGRLEGVIVDPR